MTVRRALYRDLKAIVRLALQFGETSQYRGSMPATDDGMESLGAYLLDQGVILIAEERGEVLGMLAAQVAVNAIRMERVGSAVAWWIDPKEQSGPVGLRLLFAAELWALEKGATSFHTLATFPAQAEFYRSADYTEVETVYRRPLEKGGR